MTGFGSYTATGDLRAYSVLMKSNRLKLENSA